MKKIFLLTIILSVQLSFTPKDISWVAIGDSITYLNDHPDETGNRITKGYMTRVVEKFPNIHFVNKGFNGWTAINIANNIEKIDLPKADLYTVFLGTNDWWSSKPLGSIEDYDNKKGATTVYGAFRIIVDKIRSLNQEAKIVLITPMKRVDFVYISNYKNNAFGSYKAKNAQNLEDFANAIVDIAKKEHFPVIDLFHKTGMDYKNLVRFKRLKDSASGTYINYTYPDFIDRPFNPDADEFPYPKESINITFDGLHPSDKGYQMIAAALIKIFRKWN